MRPTVDPMVELMHSRGGVGVEWRGRCAALVSLAVLVSACTDDSDAPPVGPDAPAPEAPATAVETRSPEHLHPLRVGSPLVQELWAEAEGPCKRGPLPERVDAVSLAEAADLDEAPIPYATLAVGMSLFGDEAFLTPGAVLVYHPALGWRQVDMEAAGLRRADYGEQSFALSPNGELLALGDKYGVVVVEVGSGIGRRYRVPTQEPIILRWTPDSDALSFTDRFTPSDELSGRSLDLTSGTSDPTTFDPWLGRSGAQGGTIELLPAERGNLVDTVRLMRPGGDEQDVGLEQRLKPSGPPEWHTTAAIEQHYPRLGGQRVVRSIVEFDPSTGEFTAALALSKQQARWASIVGWTSAHNLLIDVSHGPQGAIVAWNPQDESLTELTHLPAQGLQPEVAVRRVADGCESP